MGDEDDSTWPPERVSNKPEPPYQALLPEFDKMSRSSFEKGTVTAAHQSRPAPARTYTGRGARGRLPAVAALSLPLRIPHRDRARSEGNVLGM